MFAAFVSTYGTTVLRDRLATQFEWFEKAA